MKQVSIILEIDTLKPTYNKLSAKFRKEVINGRIISWQKYVSTLSINTPVQKIWQKFRTINGSYTKPPRQALLYNGQRVHDVQDISNTLGQHIRNISCDLNLDEHSENIKKKHEAAPLNFETNEDLIYNKRFTMLPKPGLVGKVTMFCREYC